MTTRTAAILANLVVSEGSIPRVAPCMEVTTYFRHAPLAAISEFATAALAALDGDLTRFMTGQMTRFAARGKKSADAFAVMFDQPRINAQYWIVMRGDGVAEGTSAAELEVVFTPPPPLPVTAAETDAAIAENHHRFDIRAAIFTPHVSMIRATFPLHHPLAQPDALQAWLKARPLVRDAAFISGHAGYALNVDRAVGARDQQVLVQSTLAAGLARHPGLGFENFGSIGRKLLKYWPGHAGFLPRIKRVQWITLVPDLLLEELCGGKAAVLDRLAATPDVICDDLGADTAGGLMIRAGAAPAVGDVTIGDDLPAYRAVARVLAPARLPQFDGIGAPFTADAATAWLSALERDHD